MNYTYYVIKRRGYSKFEYLFIKDSPNKHYVRHTTYTHIGGEVESFFASKFYGRYSTMSNFCGQGHFNEISIEGIRPFANISSAEFENMVAAHFRRLEDVLANGVAEAK